MAGRSEPAAPTADRELVLTRVFDAPRELAFAAWAGPEHLTRWFAPRGCTVTFREMDFRPGGKFGYQGQLFIAFFGHMTPMTGKPPEEHGGHRVAAVEPTTRKEITFFGRKDHHHGGHKRKGKEDKEGHPKDDHHNKD